MRQMRRMGLPALLLGLLLVLVLGLSCGDGGRQAETQAGFEAANRQGEAAAPTGMDGGGDREPAEELTEESSPPAGSETRAPGGAPVTGNQGPGGRSAAPPPATPGATADATADSGAGLYLHVTRDFGREVLFSGPVAGHSGDTVLDVLARHLEVKTAYGGGFINAIAGLESGYTGRKWGREQKDWLYWVNGVAAALGASQYHVRPGDFIWWDYQDWGGSGMANAVVGAFPQPLVSGHGTGGGGALILYTEDYPEQAAVLVTALRRHGAGSVRSAPLDGRLLQERETPVVVLGAWEELAGIPELARHNERGPRSGFYLRLAPGEIVRVDAGGREAERFGPGSGAFWAIGNGPGDRTPVFVVTGIDRDGVRAVAELLAEAPDRCRGAFALVVAECGKVIPAP